MKKIILVGAIYLIGCPILFGLFSAPFWGGGTLLVEYLNFTLSIYSDYIVWAGFLGGGSLLYLFDKKVIDPWIKNIGEQK